MLYKRGYLIHFARLFFACLLIGICSLISHLWNVYQPIYLAFQLHRCQTVQKSNCHLYMINDYPLDVNQLLGFIHSISVIYFSYRFIRLVFFHVQLKRYQMKQNYYAHLYREDQKSRCSNRLL